MKLFLIWSPGVKCHRFFFMRAALPVLPTASNIFQNTSISLSFFTIPILIRSRNMKGGCGRRSASFQAFRHSGMFVSFQKNMSLKLFMRLLKDSTASRRAGDDAKNAFAFGFQKQQSTRRKMALTILRRRFQ